MKILQQEENLLNDTIKLALENNYYVRFPNQYTMKRASGWVNHRPKQFTVCFPNIEDYTEDLYESTWGIFLHESCHLDQILEKSPLWFDDVLENSEIDYLDYITLEKGKRSKLAEEYFIKLLTVEIDCEKRAIKKLRKYNLNINPTDYIKRGNVYLKSYYSFYHLKKWYDKNFRIYDQKEIVDSMPDYYELSVDNYWKQCKPIHQYLKKHGI